MPLKRKNDVVTSQRTSTGLYAQAQSTITAFMASFARTTKTQLIGFKQYSTAMLAYNVDQNHSAPVLHASKCATASNEDFILRAHRRAFCMFHERFVIALRMTWWDRTLRDYPISPSDVLKRFNINILSTFKVLKQKSVLETKWIL